MGTASGKDQSNCESVSAAVQRRGETHQYAAESCKRDHDLAAVRQNGLALQFATESCRSDREIVLAAVQKQGEALQYAAESVRGDRDIILAAVKQNGLALQFVAGSVRGDRDIILAAVKQNGLALHFVAESFRSDREIVLTAIQKVRKGLEALVLRLLPDELIEDSSFAIDAKESCHILKISMISGRQAIVLSERDHRRDLNTEEVLRRCCDKLGIRTTGSSMCLVSGDDVVPARTVVSDWPGIRATGEISEYQLVVQQS
eukprot:795030-Amphidinium_carterae.1